MQSQPKFAARIANLPGSVLIVEQTRYNEKLKRYVIDYDEDKNKIERHVEKGDDTAIGVAIRLALEGRLTKK